jgi:cbb3-type cytochrome oxidase subunit 1
VLQRTSRARLPDQLSPWFVLIGYNLFCVIAVTGYMMGITQSKEYAEPEWYADIWLVIVWVAAIIRRPLFDESVYSMDGDIAPIAELCDVATAHSLHQA